jgi:hypothetical protein
MKTLASTIVIVAVLALLAYTNPQLDHYERFIEQEIIQKTSKQSDQLERVLGQVLGGLASTVLINNTRRTDYVFLSTYETSLGDERLRALGILNNFMVLEMPKSLEKE